MFTNVYYNLELWTYVINTRAVIDCVGCLAHEDFRADKLGLKLYSVRLVDAGDRVALRCGTAVSTLLAYLHSCDIVNIIVKQNLELFLRDRKISLYLELLLCTWR